MTSILKTIALSFVLLCSVAAASAQTTHIMYKMEGEGQAAAMISGSTMDFYFDKDNFKMVMDMMGGMLQMDMRMEVDKKEGIMLMDMMGQKQYKVLTEEDAQGKEGAEDFNPKITYLNEYETVAGYKCQKALVEVESSDQPIVVYFTDKMKMPEYMKKYVESIKMKGIKGFPLQYEMTDPNVGKIIVKAVTVETKKFAKTMFSTKIPDGYTKMEDNGMSLPGGMGG